MAGYGRAMQCPHNHILNALLMLDLSIVNIDEQSIMGHGSFIIGHPGLLDQRSYTGYLSIQCG